MKCVSSPSGPEEVRMIRFAGEEIPFGPQILFESMETEGLILSAEICEDVWSPVPPSIKAALEGAVILVNCSASDETIGKNRYREELIKGQSARLIAGYVYANAGEGESTTDVVFGGHNLIAENGTILNRPDGLSTRRSTVRLIFEGCCRSVGRIRLSARRCTRHCRLCSSPQRRRSTVLTREFSPAPFVPQNERERARQM